MIGLLFWACLTASVCAAACWASCWARAALIASACCLSNPGSDEFPLTENVVVVCLVLGPVATVEVEMFGLAGWETVEAGEAGAEAEGGGGPTVTGTDWITADWRTD